METTPGWSRFNPSLLVSPDGSIRGIVRSSNYRIIDGRYESRDGDGDIRTINHLVDVAADGTAHRARVVRPPDGVAAGLFPIHGYEDLRLFHTEGVVWAIASVRDRETSGVSRMVLLRLDDDGSVLTEVSVRGPDPGRHEKNWAPISGRFESLPVGDGETVQLVYQWDPIVIAAVSLIDGEFTELSRATSGLSGRARGGTNGVRVSGGWLFTVHESRRYPDGTARYLHRFVLVSDAGEAIAASTLTSLLADGVEFAIGAAAVGDELWLGFGLVDAEAWLARVPIDDVLAGLRALGSGGPL